jgi:hypothetical protein
VPAPRRGIDVPDAIYKCLKTWGIENMFEDGIQLLICCQLL